MHYGLNFLFYASEWKRATRKRAPARAASDEIKRRVADYACHYRFRVYMDNYLLWIHQYGARQKARQFGKQQGEQKYFFQESNFLKKIEFGQKNFVINSYKKWNH